MKNYIGIDIGGTKTAVVLGNEKGKIISKIKFPTETGSKYRSTIKKILDESEKILNKYSRKKIKSIGVSCGGPLDSEKGVILCPPNLPGWKNVRITEILSKRFNLPSYLENDANAGALAEKMFGSGKNFKNIIFLTMGTGIGAGIILDGRLYRGTNDLAGEIGHIRISDTGPIAYGKKGSFESFCSGPGLERIAKKLNPNSKLSAKDITRLAYSGDSFAINVVKICGKYLGKGIAILIDLLNPELIIIGGMAVRLKNLLLDPAREVVKRECINISSKKCRIIPSKLGENIGDISAISISIYSEKKHKILM